MARSNDLPRWKKFRQRFENGGKPVTTLEKIGTTREKGTLIHLNRIQRFFQRLKYQYETLVNDFVNLHFY